MLWDRQPKWRLGRQSKRLLESQQKSASEKFLSRFGLSYEPQPQEPAGLFSRLTGHGSTEPTGRGSSEPTARGQETGRRWFSRESARSVPQAPAENGSRLPPRNALTAAAGLVMISVISMVNAMTEGNRYWRAGAVFSSGLAVVAAFLVWCFGRSDWVRRPAEIALVSNMVTTGRLHARAGGGKNKKKRRR